MIRTAARCTLTSMEMLRLLKPRSAARALAYALRRHLLGRRVAGTAIVALTFDCQCRCECCSSELFKGHYAGRPGMSWEEILSLIDRIAQSGSPRIHFTGGESLLHNRLAQAVEASSRRGLITFVETNGLAVDNSVVLGLKRAGVGSINVSLDSADSQVHDALRKVPGCHAKAVEALRLCVKNGVHCIVSTYATRENIRDGGLSGVIALAREIGATAVRVLAPQPSGGWLKKPEVMLKEDDLNLIEQLLPLAYPVLNRTALIDCPLSAGYKIFALPDGRMAPCEHLPFIFKDSKDMTFEDLQGRIGSCAMFDRPYRCMPRDLEFRKRHIDALGGDRPAEI